jgi:hypothetical protein
MLWLVEYSCENHSRVLLAGDSAQHRSVERGDALRILEQSGSLRYVELLQTQRQKVPALKAVIENLKAGRLQAGWEKLEHYGVIKEVTDNVELRERAVEKHLEALRTGKTSLMISPRHEEARKVAAVVRQQLKAEGAIGAEDHAVTVLRRMDLGPEVRGDLLHYAPGRIVGFHSRTAGGFRPGEKWTVRGTNCETVTVERKAGRITRCFDLQVAPHITLTFQTAASGELPFGFRWEPFTGPFRIGNSVVPGHLHNRMILPTFDTAARTFGMTPACAWNPTPPG